MGFTVICKLHKCFDSYISHSITVFLEGSFIRDLSLIRDDYTCSKHNTCTRPHTCITPAPPQQATRLQGNTLTISY